MAGIGEPTTNDLKPSTLRYTDLSRSRERYQRARSFGSTSFRDAIWEENVAGARIGQAETAWWRLTYAATL